MLSSITPLVISYNEEANLDRTLRALLWAKRVVVLDSGSQDRSHQIATSFSNVEWKVRDFDNHAGQCNYALRNLVGNAPFVLSLDADYVVTSELIEEMASLDPAEHVSAYQVGFRYCINGAALRGTLYPPRVCLYRPERARYHQDGHTQRILVDGEIRQLRAKLLHDDRKPQAEFRQRQRRYAAMEAQLIRSKTWQQLDWRKRVRRLLVVAPWLVPAYVLFIQGLVLDGRNGWRYAYERFVAEYEIARALAKHSKADLT